MQKPGDPEDQQRAPRAAGDDEAGSADWISPRTPLRVSYATLCPMHDGFRRIRPHFYYEQLSGGGVEVKIGMGWSYPGVGAHSHGGIF